MRVVIDVNVWISGALWGGTPNEILRLVYEQKIASYVSAQLLQELEATLKKSKFKTKLVSQNITAQELLAVTAAISNNVEITDIEVPNLRDPKDAKIIATAIAAKAEVLIIGDLDLLVLQSVQGVLILSPTEFLTKILT
jgi:uncharacterized protein